MEASTSMERHEIRPAAWRITLALVGAALFVTIGLILVCFGRNIKDRATGVMSIAFFGAFPAYALMTRGLYPVNLAIVPAGVELQRFGSRPRVVPWDDIEHIGVLRLDRSGSRQEFTTLRLCRYDALLNNLSEKDAQRAVREFRFLVTISRAAIQLGGGLGDTSAVEHAVAGSEHVRSVAAILQHNRQKYGAEILLGWDKRDRKAAAFAEYLETWRTRHSS